MNTIALEPAVRDFLDVVRADLADLDPEERREILDGLEADLGELVAEHGPEALGDPHAYARELRAAAGIDEVADSRKRPIRASATAFLDACHARFDALVARLPWDATPLLAWLRPLWWVIRAWLAVQLIGSVTSGHSNRFETVPDLGGVGWLVLVAAIAGSVQLGRGRLWPGGSRGVLARLVLVGLNVVAVAVALVTLDRASSDSRYWDGYGAGYDQGFSEATRPAESPAEDGEESAMTFHGKVVTNVFPYDAEGRPLAGVQLFDQSGKPLTISASATCPEGAVTLVDDPDPSMPSSNAPFSCEDQETYDPVPISVLYPWTNGRQEVLNVFPLPSRPQPNALRSATAFAEKLRPRITFPMASVPKATLPGVRPGVQGPAR